jgi:hypothetical protein
MALIDRTYFVGELNIPNTAQAAVGSLLDLFIEKYEEEFLRKALGYSLHKALKAGLEVVPVAQKWTDLIEGVEYTDQNNQVRFWSGLVSQPPSVLNALDAVNTISIQVGGGGAYDPVAGTNNVTIPAALVGKDFTIEQRGVGQLLSSEYSIVGSTLTLTSGVFAINDIYIYKSATLALNTSTGTNKQSPIANYVYYWHTKNQHTQTAAMGEVKSTTENAVMTSPALKMVNAWNQMSRQICELSDYLDAKKDDYTEWADLDVWCMRRYFRRINEFGI